MLSTGIKWTLVRVILGVLERHLKIVLHYFAFTDQFLGHFGYHLLDSQELFLSLLSLLLGLLDDVHVVLGREQVRLHATNVFVLSL